jgi:O-phospho-L-seryl-tRNASec:L-selenocysteinyl-tRNA synthase
MDPEELSSLFQSLKIPETHATVGFSNLIASNKQFMSLFINRRLPDEGWSDVQIQSFLFLLSTLDTNNKLMVNDGDTSSSRWCGVGEREGRVYSSLVAHRHFGLSHGMGRSGDITEPQPKAVGSSVMVKLTLLLVLDAIRRASGLEGPAKHGLLLPMCTGMSMSLVLSALRQEGKDVVLWSRIDQKSCFKAVQTAGLKCVVVPTRIEMDEVVTDLDAMESLLNKYEGRILAVITTSSCFAPRVPDHVDKVAKLCAQHDGVAHVINNAYGLQCKKTCKLISRACVVGRVDAVVCSTDKNFLVPVGTHCKHDANTEYIH